MAPNLQFFLHCLDAKPDYSITPFGPAEGGTFHHGVTMQFDKPGFPANRFLWRPPCPGHIKYVASEKAVYLRPNAALDTDPESATMFVFRGLNIDFEQVRDALATNELLHRDFERNSLAVKLRQGLPPTMRDDPNILNLLFLAYQEYVRSGQIEVAVTHTDIEAAAFLGRPIDTLSHSIATSLPLDVTLSSPNSTDPAAYWARAHHEGRVASRDSAALVRALELTPLRFLVELRDDHNRSFSRFGNPSANFPPVRIRYPNSTSEALEALPEGVATVMSSGEVVIESAADHALLFFNRSAGTQHHASLSLMVPPHHYHVVVLVTDPRSWFAPQFVVPGHFRPEFPLAGRRVLRRYSLGNLVTPLLDGHAYFASIAENLGDATSWHSAGWAYDISTKLGTGASAMTLEEHITVLKHCVLLLAYNMRDTIDYIIPDFVPVGNASSNIGKLMSALGVANRFHADKKTSDFSAIHMKVNVVRISSMESVGYCGGIDFWRNRETDESHADADGESKAIHDVQMKVTGPAVEDLDLVLYQRWVDKAQDPEVFVAPPPTPQSGSAGPHVVQVARTVPAPSLHLSPFSFASQGDHTIFLSLLTAIGRASHYIYIEDQYFRDPSLVDALVAAIRRVHFLIVMVPQWDTGRGNWADEKPRKIAGRIRVGLADDDQFARKVRFCHLVGAGNIYIHAKLQIVDGIFVSCGSANLDQNGLGANLDHDASQECNLMILDECVTRSGSRVFGEDLRMRLWAEHLEIPNDQRYVLEDPIAAFAAYWDPTKPPQGRVRFWNTEDL